MLWYPRKVFLSAELWAFWFLFVNLIPANAGSALEQIITNIDEILKANPLPPGEKSQTITIAQTETATLVLARAIEGSIGAKPHVHKTHDEAVYIVKGTAQLFINGKLVDFNAGSLHFNPMGSVHTFKRTGSELVYILIWTPGMKEMDRHIVEWASDIRPKVLLIWTIYEMGFPEGANMKAPRGFRVSLWGLSFSLYLGAGEWSALHWKGGDKRQKGYKIQRNKRSGFLLMVPQNLHLKEEQPWNKWLESFWE